MEFKKSLDELDTIVKLILAILPVVNLIWVVYAIIRDQKNTVLVVLDILFGLFLGFVFYFGNIISLSIKGEVLSFEPFLNDSKSSTSDEEVEVEVVDKED